MKAIVVINLPEEFTTFFEAVNAVGTVDKVYDSHMSATIEAADLFQLGRTCAYLEEALEDVLGGDIQVKLVRVEEENS